MFKMSKVQLIAWIMALQTDEVDVDVVFCGGGTSAYGPDGKGCRSVASYTVTLNVCEECADTQPMALSSIRAR